MYLHLFLGIKLNEEWTKGSLSLKISSQEKHSDSLPIDYQTDQKYPQGNSNFCQFSKNHYVSGTMDNIVFNAISQEKEVIPESIFDQYSHKLSIPECSTKIKIILGRHKKRRINFSKRKSKKNKSKISAFTQTKSVQTH